MCGTISPLKKHSNSAIILSELPTIIMILMGLCFQSVAKAYVKGAVTQHVTGKHSSQYYTTTTSMYHGLMLLTPNPGTAIRRTRQCFSTHWSDIFMFLANRRGTQCGHEDLQIVRSEMPFSAPLLYCNVICLFVARLLACTILAILLLPLSSTKCFLPHDCR
jgi:hypothetical protein